MKNALRYAAASSSPAVTLPTEYIVTLTPGWMEVHIMSHNPVYRPRVQDVAR